MELSRPRRPGHDRRTVLALAMVGWLVAGCGLFNGAPSPSTTEPPTSAPTPSPSPTPRIKLVTFIGSIEEPRAATPTGLVWSGIEQVATATGATVSLVQPASDADFGPDLESAAQANSVVVTAGPGPAAAVEKAAMAHPDAIFIEVGVVPVEGSPANVHGLVFDQAQAGYLAGFIAATYAGSAPIAFVGDSETDVPTQNYAAGFAAGADFVTAKYPVSLGYGSSPNSPDRGRTAAAALVNDGAVVIAAMPDLTGIGAMRQACSQQTRLVGLDRDVWSTVPDVDPCVIGSVVFRYDAAVRDAILALEDGGDLQPLVVGNVASGGIAVSAFHIDPPAGLQARLDAVLAALAALPASPAA